MTVLAFDTLKAANRLRQAGFDEKQAHELVTTFAEGMGENVATKDDIESLRKDINARFESLEQRMTIKLGGMLVAGVAFLTVLNRLFPPG